jgi:general secretion pathway protein I
MSRFGARRGFTLLEVVIALAILSTSLMAIFNLNSGAVASHGYAKRLTVATLLARGKMIDLEQKIHDEGAPGDDDEESGDFSEEGWPSFKWRAKIIAPKTSGVTPEQLLSALFNVPMGGEGGGGLEGLLGGEESKGGGEAAGAGMLGPLAGLAQGQFAQMTQQIAQAVREVHLTVSWKDGRNTESVDVVTHVVSLGPGSDRNGGGVAGEANAAQGQDVYVNAQTGQPISGQPKRLDNGQLVDPQTNQPVMLRSEWTARQGAGRSGGGPHGFSPAGVKK